MNWNELEQAWRGQARAFAPPAWNLAEFEAQRRQRARRLAARDWLEAGTGFAVSAFFAAFLLLLGVRHGAGWLAVAIVAAVSVFFLRERWRARGAQVPAEAPLAARLEAEVAELRQQRRLLRSVMVWYLAPLLTAMTLFVVALRDWAERAGGMLSMPSLVGLAASGVAIAGIVWWLNRVAVRDWIDPQLADCERALAELRDRS